jgi:hypothetical protein
MGAAVSLQPFQSEVAFLLAADGSIERLVIPQDDNGVPFALGSIGMRLFVEEALEVVFDKN